MLLPHELFAAIYHNYPDIWRDSVCPGGMNLKMILLVILYFQIRELVLFEWVAPYTSLENNCRGSCHRQGRVRNIFPYMLKQWPLGTKGKEYIKRFWRSVSSGAQYMTHPIRLIDGHEEWAIPIKLHGDGTPVTGLGKSWGKIMDIWCLCNVRNWT